MHLTYRDISRISADPTFSRLAAQGRRAALGSVPLSSFCVIGAHFSNGNMASVRSSLVAKWSGDGRLGIAVVDCYCTVDIWMGSKVGMTVRGMRGEACCFARNHWDCCNTTLLCNSRRTHPSLTPASSPESNNISLNGSALLWPPWHPMGYFIGCIIARCL